MHLISEGWKNVGKDRIQEFQKKTLKNISEAEVLQLIELQTTIDGTSNGFGYHQYFDEIKAVDTFKIFNEKT
jgi:hypothetical protein